MLKLILPRPILEYIDSNRASMSRATYILKCVNYIMINNINLNNEGECNDNKSKGSISRRQNINNDRL